MKEEMISLENERIKWLSEITLNSLDLVGEKAAFLGELYSNKIVSKNCGIPEGFVITKKAISEFFTKNKLSSSIINIFQGINWENYYEIETASKSCKDLILNLDFPEDLESEIIESYLTLGIKKIEDAGAVKDILSNAAEPIFVAIRSSYSNESGDSYFNVKGHQNLLYSIKKSIASYFEPEVLLGEKEKGILVETIRPAIIIQKMIQSDKSGIVFSKDKIVINALWGLGGGLKIDKIGQDEYVLRRDFKILEKIINEKKFAVVRNSDGSLKLVELKEGYSFSQVLKEYELQELADVALRIDDVFGKRMQFEFAYENEMFYIVKIKNLILEKSVFEEKVVEEVCESPLIVQKIRNILPAENITKTKIDLLIRNDLEAEEGKMTGIKRGIILMEDLIKKRGYHPNYYLENFDTKGYGDLIYEGLSNLSSNLQEVYVRLSDFTSTQFSKLEGASQEIEENPLMGLCGIRYLLLNQELLKRELKAISDLGKEKKVCVLIPKISSLYELKKVKSILESLNSSIDLGIILETPASIQLIKDFIDEGIKTVVFCGNSLSKYLLCVDPNNKNVRDFYDDTSPALMYQLEYVIRVCKRREVVTKFMGDSLKKKEMVDCLIKKEIDSVILVPEEVHDTSLFIGEIEKEFILGTDKEARNYELNKEKERQKKEISKFERVKEIAVKEEVRNISEKEKKISEEKSEEINLNQSEANLKIFEKGLLKQNEEEIFDSVPETFIEGENLEESDEELVEEDIFETNGLELKENKEILFDEEIEKFDENFKDD